MSATQRPESRSRFITLCIAGTDIESSRQTEESLWRRNSRIRLLIAFAVSLSLHLVAFALLVYFIPANGITSERSTALLKAQLIVTIAKPEKTSRITVPPSGGYPRNTNEATQSTRNGSTSPSSSALLPEHYFSTSELDVIPQIQRDIDLYPLELHNLMHSGGKVVLSLWIDETGRVTKVEPVNSELPAVFAEVSTRIFMQANFLPGRKNGSVVKSKVNAVLRYPSHDANQ